MGYAWSRRDETVGAGFLRIATEQIAKAILNADAVSDPASRRIHAARRHCKRLRGLFRLVRSDFGQFRPANAAVRDAARHLAATRDAAVLWETLEKLHDWAGYPPPARLPEPATGSDEEAALQTFRTAMSALMKKTSAWRLDRIDARTVARGFADCYGRAAQAAEKCRRKPDDESFHDWRKQVKYHSFHLILLKTSLQGAEDGTLDRAEQLAELLGQHHDLALLRQTVESSAETFGGHVDARFVANNSRLMQERLAARAFGLADTLFARPKTVVRHSVSTRWTDWWQPRAAAE